VLQLCSWPQLVQMMYDGTGAPEKRSPLLGGGNAVPASPRRVLYGAPAGSPLGKNSVRSWALQEAQAATSSLVSVGFTCIDETY
jgi:hypothetical protein